MKIDFKKIDKNKIEIMVEIPTKQMNEYFDLAASELSKDLKIDGFRPGKAPIEIVEQHLGSQKLYDQAANLAIQKTLSKVVADLPKSAQGLKADIIGQPELSITKIARGESMTYKAVFSIIPDVKLGQYKGLKIKKTASKVEPEEIKKSLEFLQNSRAKLVTVKRSIKKGDRVEIDFKTTNKSQNVGGGSGENHPLIIGEGRFLPGFEKKLEGLKTGQEEKFSLTVPQDWPQKALAGQKLDFEVKIKLVQEREIPKLSDEFAKSLGHFKSLKELEKSVAGGLEEEKTAKDKEKKRMELIEKAVQNSEMEVPETLIEMELDKMIQEIQVNTQNAGLSFEKYLKDIKKTVPELRKEWRPQATKRAKIGLTLKAIANKENIKAEEKEIKERIEKLLSSYPNKEEIEKKVDREMLKRYTEDVIRNEKVFSLLEKEAKII